MGEPNGLTPAFPNLDTAPASAACPVRPKTRTASAVPAATTGETLCAAVWWLGRPRSTGQLREAAAGCCVILLGRRDDA
jgi:hypothetical protein